jgi:hypothetical protein
MEYTAATLEYSSVSFQIITVPDWHHLRWKTAADEQFQVSWPLIAVKFNLTHLSTFRLA